MAGPAYSTTWPVPPAVSDLSDDRENEILGGAAERKVPVDGDAHRLRGRLDERLGGEHVLDLRRPDAEGQRAERAVGRGVAVPAHDGRSGQCEALLGSDDVDDAVARVVDAEQRNPELLAVADQGVDLELRVLAHPFAAVGGDVVVDHRDGRVGAPHPAPRLPQPLVGLRGRHLVGEVTVDVEQAGAVFLGRDDVAVPDFLEQGPWLRHRHAPGTVAGCRASGIGQVSRPPWIAPGMRRGGITARREL